VITAGTWQAVALVGCGAFGTFVLDAIRDIPGLPSGETG
jgi:predicted dinucleotide-utilizing enzyme